MTPQEMQARSSEKVKQILALMAMLNIHVEAKERVTEGGFIEKTVFWVDDEKYLPPAGPIPESVIAKEEAPDEDAPTGPTA